MSSLDTNAEQSEGQIAPEASTAGPLSRPQITTAIKESCERAEMSDTTRTAIFELTANGQIFNIELLFILVLAPKDGDQWHDIRKAALTHLTKNDRTAIVLLTQVAQQFPATWNNMKFTDTATAAGFITSIDISIDGEPVHIDGAPRPNKKDSKAVTCVAFWYNHSGQTPDLETVAKKKSAPTPGLPVSVPATGKNAPKRKKNAAEIIHEFCVTAAIAAPIDKFSGGKMRGKSVHCVRELTVPAVTNPLLTFGSGKSKHEAILSASKRLLTMLQQKNLITLID